MTTVATTTDDSTPPARLAVLGAGWWSQGWHLPHLDRHPHAVVAAIVEPSGAVRSSLNPHVLQLDALGARYGARTFRTLDELLAAGVPLDGVVVGASHAAHYELGRKALEAGLHVFMEKPMTTDPAEARELADAARRHGKTFMVNNTANWRDATRLACEWVAGGRIGAVTHVSCYMGSPLLWLFDDPANEGWNRPSGTMLGNGMGWGQLSHTIAWVLRVTGLEASTVYCEMSHSDVTGADKYDAAVIRCTSGALISVQGVGAVAGERPAEGGEDARPTGKQIENRIFGTEGFVSYGGVDHKPDSGALLLRRHDYECDERPGFLFEDGDQGGIGPASLQAFVAACRGAEGVWNGCDAEVGHRVVCILEAMYRSAAEGRRVSVVGSGGSSGSQPGVVASTEP